jgi:general secretion pathway protein D
MITHRTIYPFFCLIICCTLITRSTATPELPSLPSLVAIPAKTVAITPEVLTTPIEKNTLEVVAQKSSPEDTKNTDSPESLESEILSLNFEKTSLAAIVNFLADRKNINVIPHKDLANATISLYNYKPLTVAQAWDMLPTLLEINGFTMNKVGNIYRIVSSKESGREPLAIYSSATGTSPKDLPETDQMLRYVYFLRNIKAENAQSILNTMLTDKNAVEINRDLDVLFMKEKSLNIKAAMEIIEELDQTGLRQAIQIIKLNYESAVAIAKLFNDQLLGPKTKADNAIRFLQLNKTEVNYFSPNVKIMPDVARNTLILIGQEKDIQRIKDFINTFLDVEPIAESRVHIRDIKYLPAEQMQKLVTNIIKPPQGISKEDLANNNFFEDVNIVAETPTSTGGLYGSGNRLIVTCGKEDWQRINKLIDKLDRPQRQIALEVLVIDVSSNAGRQLGMQFRQKNLSKFLDNTLSYGTATLTETTPKPSAAASMLEAGTSSATTGAVLSIGPSNNLWAILRAMMSETNANIITQPFTVVANRKTANFSAGKTQNVIGAFKNVQGLREQEENRALNSINITPSINSKGIVDLNIKINFEDFEGSTTSNEIQVGNNKTTRSIETRAAMAEGEVLILGGLTRSKQTDTLYGLEPFASIPIIGNLFKSKRKVSDKKNLYIFIRPSLVKPESTGYPDPYTEFKIDYAKRQVFNFQSYGKSSDPIQHFFFKPRKSTISSALDDVKSNRFSWIDNFTERRSLPPAMPYGQKKTILPELNALDEKTPKTNSFSDKFAPPTPAQ